MSDTAPSTAPRQPEEWLRISRLDAVIAVIAFVAIWLLLPKVGTSLEWPSMYLSVFALPIGIAVTTAVGIPGIIVFLAASLIAKSSYYLVVGLSLVPIPFLRAWFPRTMNFVQHLRWYF
jgi:hypothetical protein